MKRKCNKLTITVNHECYTWGGWMSVKYKWDCLGVWDSFAMLFDIFGK